MAPCNQLAAWQAAISIGIPAARSTRKNIDTIGRGGPVRLGGDRATAWRKC